MQNTCTASSKVWIHLLCFSTWHCVSRFERLIKHSGQNFSKNIVSKILNWGDYVVYIFMKKLYLKKNCNPMLFSVLICIQMNETIIRVITFYITPTMTARITIITRMIYTHRRSFAHFNHDNSPNNNSDNYYGDIIITIPWTQ